MFGIAFLIVGVGFKLGAVPFHMWIPDVYEGSPTCVTVFIGTASKLAAFALAMRLLPEALAASQPDWSQMLVVLAVLSMAIGNIVAIAQSNIKRMLAYSTISHIGYVLLGILSGTAQGYQAAMFYMISYVIVAGGAFGLEPLPRGASSKIIPKAPAATMTQRSCRTWRPDNPPFPRVSRAVRSQCAKWWNKPAFV